MTQPEPGVSGLLSDPLEGRDIERPVLLVVLVCLA